MTRPDTTRPDTTQVLDVVDYWVIERKLFDVKTKQKLDPPGARWRVAARLQIEEGGAGGSSGGEAAGAGKGAAAAGGHGGEGGVA